MLQAMGGPGMKKLGPCHLYSVLYLDTVLPTLRFSREFSLVFFYGFAFFLRLAGYLFLGLF